MAQRTTGKPDAANTRRKLASAKIDANPHHPGNQDDAAWAAQANAANSVPALRALVRDQGEMLRYLVKLVQGE